MAVWQTLAGLGMFLLGARLVVLETRGHFPVVVAHGLLGAGERL